MRGGDLRMPQPGLDGQEIHPGLQQRHRERVPHDMWRNGFTRQFRHVRRSRGDRPPHDVRRPETCQARSMCADEKRFRLMASKATLAHQRLQRFGEILGDRHDPFLASLAAQEHLWSWPIELKIAGVDPERFGNARAGSREEK